MFSTSLLLALVTWLVVGSVLTGLGALVLRLGRAPARGIDDLLLSFWLGWVCLIFLLEIWHLFLPIGPSTFAFAGPIGLAGLVLLGGRFWLSLCRKSIRHLPAIALLTVFGLFLSNLALAPASHGDSGAYFLPTVMWIREYSIVPGLGNLSVLLGFNQSYFLYVAFLDVGPIAGHFHNVANGLLVLVLAARGFLGVSRLIRYRHSCTPQDIFYSILLPAATTLGFGIFLTSPSPDLPVFVLGVVLTGQLLAFLSPSRPSGDSFDLLVLALIAVGGVKVKQSFGGLAAGTLILAGSVWLWRERSEWRRSLPALGIAAAISLVFFLPWVVRSIILTGYPLYPSSLLALPVEWRMKVDWESWIGNMMRFSLREVFFAPRGFLKRLHSFGWVTRDVIVPLAVAAASTVAGLAALCVRLARRKKAPPRKVSFLILLPTAASFVFCLVNAPMARYFGSVYWLLAAEAALLALGGAIYELGRSHRRASLAAICIAAACVPGYLESSRLVKRAKFAGIPPVPVKKVQLTSGLSVNVPVGRCSCWTAPLPCTPTPNQALRLRRAGDLESGFMIDPEIEWERHPDGDPRCQMGKPRDNSK